MIISTTVVLFCPPFNSILFLFYGWNILHLSTKLVMKVFSVVLIATENVAMFFPGHCFLPVYLNLGFH
jgi:hypothetical protein